MSDWKVIDEGNDVERPVDSRAEAEETVEELKEIVESAGGDPDNIKVQSPKGEERANITADGNVVQQGGKPDGGSDVVETQADETPPENIEPDTGSLDAVAEKDIATDPLSVMPQHFVDQIQGVPTINRKGYAVLAEHFNVSVTAEPITLPSETDFEYAEFRAVATTEDGTEYSGFGSAHVDRQDGDDPHLLAELAETRAMKRATAWATGVGITAYSEMSNSL